MGRLPSQLSQLGRDLLGLCPRNRSFTADKVGKHVAPHLWVAKCVTQLYTSQIVKRRVGGSSARSTGGATAR
jgi:hypothetical protein